MNVVRKERSSLFVGLAVLVAISAFWLLFVPRTRQYRIYKHEYDLKHTLQALTPPEGATVSVIKSWHQDGMFAEYPTATGIYLSDSNFEKLKTYYQGEFARQGFIYKGENNSAGSPSAHFCAPHYNAELMSTKSNDPLHIYIITMNWKDVPC